jgi:ABC-type multidrug transport system fused ATPase/permease subunit
VTPIRRISSIDLQEILLNENEKTENNNEKLSRSCFHTPFFIKLLKLNSPEKFYLIVGFICALLFGSVEPAVALLYSMIYGLLANPNLDDQSLRTRNLSLGILGIYILGGILQFLSTVTFTKAGEALTLRMRLFTFESMLRREMSWFDEEKNSVGSLITRLSNDTAALKVNFKSI